MNFGWRDNCFYPLKDHNNILDYGVSDMPSKLRNLQILAFFAIFGYSSASLAIGALTLDLDCSDPITCTFINSTNNVWEITKVFDDLEDLVFTGTAFGEKASYPLHEMITNKTDSILTSWQVGIFDNGRFQLRDPSITDGAFAQCTPTAAKELASTIFCSGLSVEPDATFELQYYVYMAQACEATNGCEFTIRQGIPEPTTLALLGLSLAGLGWSRRKKI